MKHIRRLLGLVGILLVLLAVWQISAAARGLKITRISSTAPPMTIMTARGAGEATRPLVLVAHGIAGSDVIMRGFALTLAHAGYTTVSWDFDGHGANPQPFAAGMQTDALIGNAEAALCEALARGFGRPDMVAILGHSMGSGVALSYGQRHPETAATIAVSPTGQPVTPTWPRNLLLMAGSLETRFVRNAEDRLSEAGGPGGDPVAGTARKLVVIPGVEHISILFSPNAHASAREWLDTTFGAQPGAVDYVDRRVLWYGLGVLGALLASVMLAPSDAGRPQAHQPKRPVWWRMGALVVAALVATLALWLAGQAGLEIHNLLGLLVGGYLLVWFGVAGVVALLLLANRPPLPPRRALLAGLLAFGVLWLGVGLLGQLVWLPWLLIPRRLILWPLGFLLLLPWFLAVGEVMRGEGEETSPLQGGRIGWWLGHTAVLLGGLFLALQLNPELGFLLLVMPIFPIILGLHALASGPNRGSWPYALSGALFTSWLLLAVFPLL